MIFSSLILMAYIYAMTFRPGDPIDMALPDPLPEEEYPLGDHEPDPLWDSLSPEQKLKKLDDDLDNMYKRRGLLGILGLKRNTHS